MQCAALLGVSIIDVRALLEEATLECAVGAPERVYAKSVERLIEQREDRAKAGQFW